MFVSKFNSLYNNIPQAESLNWADFVSCYSQHLVVSKKEAAPLISPAEWPQGSERKKEAVLKVHFAALDLDGVSEEVVQRLRETLEPYDFLLCTTWSHAKAFAETGLWHLRVFLPFSRPVETGEWALFWPKLNAFFDHTLDPHCSDQGRVYYVPSAPEASAYNQIIVGQGKALDVDSILNQVSSRQPQNPVSVSREALQALAKSLRSKSNPYHLQMGEVLTKVLKGDAFAGQGERDSTLFKLAGVLAEKWPKADPSILAAHFQPSLEKMNQASGDAPSLEDVIRKIVRQQENREADQVQAQETRAAVLKRRIRNAFGGQREEPYTQEELQRFADENGVSREDFTNRWIIQNGISFYIFKNGRYKKPVGCRELLNAAYKDLAPAYTAGIDVFRITAKGTVIKKSVEELVEQYGTVVESAKASFTLQSSYYDWQADTFEEAVCPLRPLQPEFSEMVHRYLKLLGGDKVEKLLDWISVVTQVDKPCAALFLQGVSGSGKTLLADGLTRLWSKDEPTELGQALGGNFNEALAKCPLVLADEQLPSFMKKEGSTAELRSFIQARSRTLTRKYKSPITLHGSVRLIITGNNRKLFHTGEALSNNDIEAIKGRLLFFDVDQPSRDYLNALPEAEHDSLVAGDAIAKHALWLRDNHEIREKDRRLLVTGTNTPFHQSLMTDVGIRSDICCWLVSYLQNPGKMQNDKEHLIRVFEGDLLVHSRALISYWKTYPTNINPPAASLISNTLVDLSDGRRQLKDGRGKPMHYRKVRKDLLLSWNENNQFATEEEIMSALQKGESV